MLVDWPILFGLDEHRRGKGDAPVHHQHFAEVAEHHVLGLQVAVDHAAGMGEGDRVGHAHQNPQVLGQRLLADDLRPGRAADPLHGVEQRAQLARAQVVDRHDVGVVELAGDDRLGEELVAVVALVGELVPQHLDRHGAVDRRLAGGIDHAHAAFADHFLQLELVRGLGDLAGQADA